MTLTENPYNLPQMLVAERLSTPLFQSYVAEASRIRLHMELDEVAFDLDTAIPCGLLNELLTNALKYAFPDGRSGDIYIRLPAEGERVTLRVHDTGIGFPPRRLRFSEYGVPWAPARRHDDRAAGGSTDAHV